VGLSALLAASEVGFLALRVVGAGYLVWLGVGMLRQAFGAEREATAEPEVRAESWWANARRGLLTNLLNPKVGAFYLALLPQFLPAGESPLLIGLLLGAVHAAESVVWFAVMIGSAHLARAWFESRRTRRAIDGASGAAMIGFGVYLAAKG
ncbi:MAG: LysE family translocator, partial [Micropruina sp.]